jgi:hypothetical protein
MINPEELWISEEQVRANQAAQAAKNGNRKARQSRKPSKVDFLQFSIPLLLTLCNAKAHCTIWAMVCALSEAWFSTGLNGQHLNPFPLSRMNASKWGLDRNRKWHALEFLTRIRLIRVDRSDPQNVTVTIFWAPCYSP